MLNPNLGSFVNKTNLGGINKLSTPKQVELQPKEPDGPKIKTSAVWKLGEDEPIPEDIQFGDLIIYPDVIYRVDIDDDFNRYLVEVERSQFLKYFLDAIQPHRGNVNDV